MVSGPSSGATSPRPPNGNSQPPIQKSYSCIICSQRKVKCDKLPGGCTNCTKSRIQCVYKAPPPPRRRKKGLRELDVHARLRLYEDALRKLGVDPAQLENEELSKIKARRPPTPGKSTETPGSRERHDETIKRSTEDHRGVLLSGDGKSRYLENGLWTGLQGEFRSTQDLLDSSDDELAPEDIGLAPSPEWFSPGTGSILFATPRSSSDLRQLHPEPLEIFKLWQIYLQNVNPLIKCFHAPSVQKMILDASANLDDIPKNVEALMFAIYCISAGSLTDAECETTLHTNRTTALHRFRIGVQHALVNASFLKSSDIIVLQALTIFLLSLPDCDARIMWMFTGITGRIGQRIGLHRDGEALGLPPFEVEMRRRLWWQIIMLDGFAEKLAGSGGHILTGDTKRPSNLNDSDLFPGMKELPQEHTGSTEMMFFLIRCHLGERFRDLPSSKSTFDGVWSRLTTGEIALTTKQKAIDDLEKLYEEKYIRYCDTSIPWHYLCTYLAKNIIALLKFIALNPQPNSPVNDNLSQADKDTLFNTSLQITKWMNIAYKEEYLRGFTWHVNLNFQWKSFIYLISELRVRTEGSDVDEAWREIQLVYDNHPSFSRTLSKRALPVAVGSLTFKAWEVFVRDRGTPPGGEPGFIVWLREKHGKKQEVEKNGEEFKKPSMPSDGEVGFIEQKMEQIQPQIQPPVQSQSLFNPMGPNFAIPAAAPALVQDESAQSGQQQGDVMTGAFSWDQEFADSLSVEQIPELPPFNPDQMNWDAWDNLLVDFQTYDS